MYAIKVDRTVFGIKTKMGLASSIISQDVLSKLQTKEDLLVGISYKIKYKFS